MMLATFLPPATPSPFRGALNKRGVYLSILCLFIATLWNTHSVTAAPAKNDSLGSTFPLDLQPPIFEATASQAKGDKEGTTIDSYGNPIESLQPIETPDGRKVVSAQGLQFEIPNYASGITELKKPADDLLPPFVGEFSNDFDSSTTTTTTETAYSINDIGQSNDDRPGIDSKDDSLVFVNSQATKSDQQKSHLRSKRQLSHTTTTTTRNTNNNNTTAQLQDEVFKAQHTNNYLNNTNVANTKTNTNTTTNLWRQERKVTANNNNNNTPSSNVVNSLSFNLKTLKSISPNINSPLSISTSSSTSYSPSSSPLLNNNTFQLLASPAKLSAHYAPLSNGNFNYPNIPTDVTIIEHLVSKYKNPLPTLDPIVVALPNAGPSSSAETTTIDVESVPLIEFKSSSTTARTKLPEYILELNDPDIQGPVDYNPTQDEKGSKVIAWDLLPPLELEEADKSISHSDKVNVNNGHNINVQIAQESSQTAYRTQWGTTNSLETTTKPNYSHFSSSSSTTSTAPRTTTTRPKTTISTTTPRTTTTTTRRTTTPRTTTTTTTPEPDSSEFFKLAAGDSYTLPTWLEDIDDPDLDVAVPYIVPEDNNEYNHTIVRDLLPPLEPYTDLNNLHVTPPDHLREVTTTPQTTTTRRTTLATTPRTTTTTTTRRSALSTSQPHWIRAKPTATVKPTIATFNHQFTSLSPTITSTNFAPGTTTSTTTSKPKTSFNYYNRQYSSNTSTQTDKIGDSSSSSEEIGKNQKNPFLPSFDDGKYRPQATSRRTGTITSTTTTTTTTTTEAPEIEKNPFEPTLPPWLKDFDYADLAPGVPFVYDPNEDENPLDKDILPPAKTEDSNPSTSPTNSPPFSNSQTPQGFSTKFSSSATSLTSSSSIPSIVTIPLPSTQTNQDANTFKRPPLVFVPPTSAEGFIIGDDLTQKTSSTFNKNFAAPFDSASASNSATTATTGGNQNNVITGSSTQPSKTTFIKSEDGKVITNNIFLSGSLGSTSAKPFGSSQTANTQEKNTFTTQSFSGSTSIKSSTDSTVFKQFGSTSAAASGFVTAGGATNTYGATSSSEGSKYTGRFGGPPGVLAPQDTAFSTSSTTITKSYNKPAFSTSGVTATPQFSANNNHKFTGSFGGPPGVLKPYDNVKTR